MKKLALVLIVIFTMIFMSCGGNQNTKNTENSVTKVKSTQEKQDQPKMTVERASKLNFERASLLMDNYWVSLKDKEFADVKDILAKYEKADEEIYPKYGVSVTKQGWNKQSFVYWARDHKDELRVYRKEHPDYDFYTKYPEYKDAVIAIYHLDEAKWKSEKK